MHQLLGFLNPFLIMPKEKFGKKRVTLFLARFEPTTHQLASQVYNQFNQIMFVIISYDFKMLLSRLAFKYIIQIMHTLK